MSGTSDAPADWQSSANRVRRFLDEYERPHPFAPRGFLPVNVLAVLTRTDDRLLASDLRMLLARAQTGAGGEPECATCSGRGVWMDEPCSDCPHA